VREHDRPHCALLAGEHPDHGVPDPTLLEVGAQVGAAERRRQRDDRRVGVDQRGQLLGDKPIGRLHGDALGAGAVGGVQDGPVGAEQQHLGDLRAERLERACQGPVERLGDLGRPRERPVGLVQELQLLVTLALGDVRAVDGEHRQRGNQQHGHRPRVGGDHQRSGDRDAGVRDRDQGVGGEHLAEGGEPQPAFGDRDGPRDQEDGDEAAGQGRDVEADPRQRLERISGREQPQDGNRDARGERELGEVEGQLDERHAAIQAPDDAGADQGAEDEVVAGGEHQPEHEREVGQRERVRAAEELQVNDARLGEQEAGGDHPPRQSGVGERLARVDEREERAGGRGRHDGDPQPDGA
jgi:hypothetical protein